MEMRDLTAYARQKYLIPEEHKWADFPRFSVLRHPKTGKWVALLMRQWDTDSGTEIERCDLKCGIGTLAEFRRSYLFPPLRMHGPDWVGIAFDDRTEPDIIFELFERAIRAGTEHGATLVLNQPRHDTPREAPAYQDTPLPFSGGTYQPPREVIPERLRQLRRMFQYGTESFYNRAKNFYEQARFMEDFEDEAPWSGDLIRYFPSYSDLTTRQLRGYFSWRTHARRGEYKPIAASAAYLYIYELLNGIGAASPEDVLDQLKAFEKGFLDAGYGDVRMQSHLHAWMLDFAVLRGLPPETARTFADSSMLVHDRAISTLRDPASHSDDDILSALCVFDTRLSRSPVFTAHAPLGKHLLAQIWRAGCAQDTGETSLFSASFGNQSVFPWYPLSNTLTWFEHVPEDFDYALSDVRTFSCRGGRFEESGWSHLTFRRNHLRGFLRQADLMLRRHLKIGHYLQEKPEEALNAPFIRSVLEREEQAALEAARPKITIDLTGLEQIRRDALATRDSLLTDEELAEMKEEEPEKDLPESREAPESPLPAEPASDLPLDAVQTRILLAVLRNESPLELIRSAHLLPSLAADMINESLFDEIGDNVLVCEDGRLSLVEDYREDLVQLLGGAAL